MSAASLQASGLAILTHDSPILDVAREVSALIRLHGLNAAVIGGVAVVLHGHVRTTVDVDLFTADAIRLAQVLRDAGFTWDAAHKQFTKGDVPVHLVTAEHVPIPPRRFEELQGIRTVSLADLVNMKLRSGSSNVLRAQDMADVIGLIRIHALTGAFTPSIDMDLRSAFRKLVQALSKERR